MVNFEILERKKVKKEKLEKKKSLQTIFFEYCGINFFFFVKNYKYIKKKEN